MATFVVSAEINVSGPDEDPDFDPEAIVAEALKTAPSIYLVTVTRTPVLFER